MDAISATEPKVWFYSTDDVTCTPGVLGNGLERGVYFEFIASHTHLVSNGRPSSIRRKPVCLHCSFVRDNILDGDDVFPSCPVSSGSVHGFSRYNVDFMETCVVVFMSVCLSVCMSVFMSVRRCELERNVSVDLFSVHLVYTHDRFF